MVQTAALRSVSSAATAATAAATDASQLPAAALPADVQWHQLDHTAWLETMQGTWGPKNDGVGGAKAWLKSPRLHYYHPPSGLRRNDEHTEQYFVCTAPNPDKRGPARIAVGLLEIDFEGDRSTVGLKYVTVDPGYQGKGVATKLYQLLIEHLKANNLRLYRTRPGKNTPEKFTESVTGLLDRNRIDWYRREY